LQNSIKKVIFATVMPNYAQIFEWCGQSAALTALATLALWGAVSVVTYYLLVFLLERVVKPLVAYTPTTWDDDLLNDRVLHAISHLAPPMILNYGLMELTSTQTWASWLVKATDIYIVATYVMLACALLRGVVDHVKADEQFQSYPIHGVYQALKIVIVCVGVLVCVAIVINRDPLAVVAGLGASAAVLSLVFKDTLMGLVAGIQLSANGMLHEGDWIVAPKFNADGTVITIGLITIKVCNWDKSVTTIPTYSLITESFQNWTRMQDYGARRVKRHVLIDANSVRYLTDAERADLGIAPEEPPMVNLRAFRDAMEQFLAANPNVTTKDGTTTMVRQLQPTAEGLPIEFYFFTNTTEWVAYEHIQADIFDHIYATCHRYGLRLFQRLGAADLHSN
jgi:miniconductance mechanosensitive channel